MKRRHFLGAAAAIGALFPLRARAQRGAVQPDTRDAGDNDIAGVDPYFLDNGDVDDAEQRDIEAFVGYQGQLVQGREAPLPRSGRPRRAPNYRLLLWQGTLGDPAGRFIGPLSVAPERDPGGFYEVNAQILGFHAASDDWPGRAPRGTLTIEFRSRLGGEPMTWLFGQHFEVDKAGGSSLSLTYIGQREGAKDPILSDEANVDVRIQLMRHRGKAKLLRTILKIFSSVVGLPVGGTPAATLAQSVAVVRVPRMLREGVAFSQAFFGGLAEEAPIWRSGFTAFAIAEGGSRMVMAPGLWVAIDERREIDLTGVVLEDVGGRPSLMRAGQQIDANYLILGVEISGGSVSRYTDPTRRREIIEKGVTPQQP